MLQAEFRRITVEQEPILGKNRIYGIRGEDERALTYKRELLSGGEFPYDGWP
jgi:hypothetical protein